MKKLLFVAGMLAGAALWAPAFAQTTPTIPVIVKDTNSPYWRAVLAGARKAGQDLGVNVVGLSAESESDVNGQIGVLEKAVAANPAAIVIAPAQFAALGKPIDEAARKTGQQAEGVYEQAKSAASDAYDTAADAFTRMQDGATDLDDALRSADGSAT